MSGPEKARKITDWRRTSRFYRRPPTLGLLVAVIAVPLLLGLIGWGGMDRSDREAAPTVPTVNPSATLTETNVEVPTVTLAPLSLRRNGNEVTVTGQVPDEPTRAATLDRTRALLPDANVIDLLTVIGGVSAADLTGLDDVLQAAVTVPDSEISIEGNTVTLTGTAPTDQVKAGVESATRGAWPNLKVVNNIAVNAPAAPSPGLTGECADLQADISGLLQTPIQFDTNGSAVAAVSAPLITQLADELKACPDAKVDVTGHTDNTGSDAINVPLSTSRAKAVADSLISNGVAADKVTSQGIGSAEPVAGNDTEEGRAQNRRVEITVS